MKEPLIILTGPTAVGKTKASILLAKRIGGAVISADSMQVYRHMDIGSAKIRPQEMEGIPHYLVDVLDPREEFNVVRFQEMAKEAVRQIRAAGLVPIVVGGTGFYIQALLYDIDFAGDGEDDRIRRELTGFAAREGAQALHDRLAAADPASAEKIHPNNVKRVIRALEFYLQTGKPISAHNEEERQRQSPYDFRYFVLTDARPRLYERIDRRVDQMMEEGLVEEVQRLKDMGLKEGMVSMQGLGYKEILEYLDGRCTLEDAVYRIKRDTRHFAKRQITWFKREREVIWIDKAACGYDDERIVETMLSHMKGVQGICSEDYSGAPNC